ncbi:hypothetical protein [Fusobacterium polymorphum]|uniref:Uncharacterized protein n=1 Tax=Fusobacterium nucleatum subsp. polymorphum TaxID=76857 RepID=A0A2C6CFY2_FUSNP|nr:MULTISPECIES: hypothetical protein [Fusobacterium]MBW9311628.1 hypothetical protein [Fusobacterium nucleatum]PHI15363.1 hypothetical protein CBG56_05970 [Fusobacterium polymorphum]
MFSLRGSRKRKTEEIIKKFLRSYAENEKSQDKKDLKTWLISELQNELPNKKVEDIEKIAIELISGIEIYYQKKKEVEKYQSVGITNGDYIGNEILEKVADEIEEAEIVDTKEVIEDMKEASNILSQYNETMIYETASIKEAQLVANVLSTKSVNSYIDTVNTTIDNANKTLVESVITKAGTINQNPNLDGFIFEEYHAGTFNIDAAVKQKSYHAEALKPELGETYGKNSVDLAIKDDAGKYVKKYSAKAYKNANETAKSFYNKITGYKYKFQSKLVPTDQVGDIANSVDKVKYNNVESKGITKAEIKDIQNDLQSGNKKVDILNFKKDVNSISISKQIGKQAMLNGTMGLGIGMVANVGINIIQGKEVEAEEVIEAGIKTGASMGMATAVAGGIRVAAEKKVIPTVFSRILTNNTIGAIAVSSMDIIGTAFKLGNGEISLGKAVKDVGNSLGAGYGAIISSGIGFSGGMALATTIGLGTIGTVGTILTGGLALVAGAVCGVIGSNIALKIANGLGKITETVVDKAVDIVKSGMNTVKNMASGFINTVKSMGSVVSSGISRVVGWFKR